MKKALLLTLALIAIAPVATEATFWFVLPSLPMFLLVPLMLRQGYNFLGIAARWMRAYRSLLCSSDVDRPQVRDTALGPIAAFI
jgi:hypothetical protein